jgi:ribosomal-protein-alanine N-acetyltransferase
MECGPEIRTERLLLRRWRPEDLGPFAAINADPRVVEFLPGPLAGRDSDALAARIEKHFVEHGFGFWAVEVTGGPSFIGLVGIANASFEASFTPAVEVGWRLASDQWGHGYASEAASAALRYGFECQGLGEIVAFTAAGNLRSRAVMERLRMTHDESDDFDHPWLAEGHPLRRHVLYRAAAPGSQKPGPSGLRFRDMAAGEELAVFGLVLRSFDRFVRRDFSEAGVAEFIRTVRSVVMEHAEGHRITVAERDGRIVGMVDMRDSSHISLFFVEPGEGGRGIGRALLDTALTAGAGSDGASPAVTVNSSPWAVSVYGRLGFVATGPEIERNGIRAVPMARRL